MAVQLATGWNPDGAEVVIGTSSGAFVSALVRNDSLTLDSLVRHDDERSDVADRIRGHIYQRGGSRDVGNWVRHGLAPGLRRPGVTLFMGSPAPYHSRGLADWVTSQIGEEAATSWPDKPTAIVAYDIEARQRTVFGAADHPDVGLAEAVAASTAIPLLFRPFPIDGRLYVDGGVASGTHADLVLGHSRPLDLVLIVAPMAAELHRKRALIHEKMFDRVGRKSLNIEKELIREAWPDCEIVTLTPSASVQNVMRPNPMDAARAVSTFMRTLISMKRKLAQPEVWSVLSDHLETPLHRSRAV
jgi:predicted acylesterase/phospholipase RssA